MMTKFILFLVISIVYPMKNVVNNSGALKNLFKEKVKQVMFCNKLKNKSPFQPLTITSFNSICKFDLVASADWYSRFKLDYLRGQMRNTPTLAGSHFDVLKKEYVEKLKKHIDTINALVINPDVDYFFILRYQKYLVDISGYISQTADLGDLLKAFKANTKDLMFVKYEATVKYMVIRGEAVFNLRKILDLEIAGKYKDAFAGIKVKIIALLKQIITFVYNGTFKTDFAKGSVYEFWDVFHDYLSDKEMSTAVYGLLALTPPTVQADIDLLHLTFNLKNIPSHLILENIVQRDLLIIFMITKLDDLKLLKNKVHFSFDFIIAFVKAVNAYTIPDPDKMSLIMHIYTWYVLLRKNGVIVDNKTVPELTEIIFSWIVKSKIWLTGDDEDPNLPELLLIGKHQFRIYITFIVIIFEKISSIKLIEKYNAEIILIIKDVKPFPVYPALEPILKPEAGLLKIINEAQLKDIWNIFATAVLAKMTTTNIFTVTFHTEIHTLFKTSFKALLYVGEIIDLNAFKTNIKDIYKFIYQTSNINFTFICNQVLKLAIAGNKDAKAIYLVLNNYIVSYLYFERGNFSVDFQNFLAYISPRKATSLIMRGNSDRILQADLEIFTAFKAGKTAKLSVFKIISSIVKGGKFEELAGTDYFINSFWGHKLLLNYIDFWNKYSVKYEKFNNGANMILYINAYRYFTDKKSHWNQGFEPELVLADMEKCLGVAMTQDVVADRLKNAECSLSYSEMSELYYFFKLYLVKSGKVVKFTETFFPINISFLNSIEGMLDFKGQTLVNDACDKSTVLFCKSRVIHKSLYEFLTASDEDADTFVEKLKTLVPKPTSDEKFLFWNSIQAIREFDNSDQTRITNLFQDQYYDAYFTDLFKIDSNTEFGLYLRRTFQKMLYNKDLNLANSVKKIMDNETTLASIFVINGIFNPFAISLFIQYGSAQAHFNNLAKIMIANKYSIKVLEHSRLFANEINMLVRDSVKTADVSTLIISEVKRVFEEEHLNICEEIENVTETSESKQSTAEGTEGGETLLEIESVIQRKVFNQIELPVNGQHSVTDKITAEVLNKNGIAVNIETMTSSEILSARSQINNIREYRIKYSGDTPLTQSMLEGIQNDIINTGTTNVKGVTVTKKI